MRVVMFGASGMIGRFLGPMLHEAGHAVAALSRQPRPDARGVCWYQGCLPDAVPQLSEVDAIISLGPLHHFATWLRQAPFVGKPRIVAMSSMSAESKRDAPLAAERDIAESLRTAETQLAQACRCRGLRWTVLRSTLIYGDGSDRSLTPIARRAMRWRVFPIPAGRGLRQPVHAQDLASAVWAVVRSDSVDDGILQIGGGERLTSRQMFMRVRAGLPGWTLPLPVPRLALRLAARLSSRHRGPITRLDQDLVADNTELTARLGVRPRDFQP